jgi:hypothetical protein
VEGKQTRLNIASRAGVVDQLLREAASAVAGRGKLQRLSGILQRPALSGCWAKAVTHDRGSTSGVVGAGACLP